MRERRAECLIVRLSRFEERPRREVECGGDVVVEGEGRLDLGRRVRGRGVGIVGAWEGGQWMDCGRVGRGVDHCAEGLRWGEAWWLWEGWWGCRWGTDLMAGRRGVGSTVVLGNL